MNGVGSEDRPPHNILLCVLIFGPRFYLFGTDILSTFLEKTVVLYGNRKKTRKSDTCIYI